MKFSGKSTLMRIRKKTLSQFSYSQSSLSSNLKVSYVSLILTAKIRKWISLSRNPSSGWISINKSKSGFHGFPSLLFNWEIRKRICKTILLDSGLLLILLIMHAGAKLLFLRTVFLNPFLDIPKNTTAKKGKLKNRYLCSIKI